MKKLTIKSFAKINLSIDVLGKLENGYHKVEMIMQLIHMHDLVSIKWMPENTGKFTIKLSTNKTFLPTDEKNIAYKAALLMAERFGTELSGKLEIYIKKTIPVAAGLAGGSGNAAAVLLGLNVLWELNLTLSELINLGSLLGADVPFSMMGQAKCNKILGKKMNEDPMAACCALASGTGTVLKPIAKSFKSYMVLSKPPISVSTAEVYKGVDEEKISIRPDNKLLVNLLESDIDEREKKLRIKKNMINVLESIAEKRYPIIVYTKDKILKTLSGNDVFMSGSGPTLFILADNKEHAEKVCEILKANMRETFWTRTML